MATEHNGANMTYIFWTGGLDSTYRMVELSRMDRTVQPIYCRNPRRDSADTEVRTMNRILEALRARPETRATLLPLKIIPKETIPEDPEITAAYKRIAPGSGLGAQYEYLARLAVSYPGIELGIEKNTEEKGHGFTATVMKHGCFLEENGIERVDPDRSSPELLKIAGNFTFPMRTVTEEDILRILTEWGYEDILSMIWFCHEPLRGKPCGMCAACSQKIEGGMEKLLPTRAVRRYRNLRNFRQHCSSHFLAETVKILNRRLI